jgi:hypothetical protein
MNRNTKIFAFFLGLVLFSGLLAAVRPLFLLSPSGQQTVTHLLRR